MNKSWTPAAGMAVLALVLAGCEGGTGGGPSAPQGVSYARSGPAPVVVTWQPQDKTAQFLSGFRAKE